MNVRNSVKKVFTIVFLLISSAWLSSCATRMIGGLTGNVVDAETQLPIENAVVVAMWEGTSGVVIDQQTSCVHMLTTTTNASGEYYFHGSMNNYKSRPYWLRGRVYAYKRGYEYAGGPYSPDNAIQLSSFIGTRHEKLKHISRIIWGTSCGAKENRREELPILFRRLYTDALELAVHDESNEVLREIRARMVQPWNPTDKLLLPDEVEEVFDEYVRPVLND